MFELFLVTGLVEGRRYFPDSGPGSKTLVAGNENLGYFGRVTDGQLYGLNEFNYAVPTPGAEITIPVDTTFGWYKFIRQGKILFLASIPVKNSVSWNQLYESGVLYGTADIGLYPTATQTYQRKVVVKQDISDGRYYEMIARTPTGTKDDPYTASDFGSVGSNEISDFYPFIRDRQLVDPTTSIIQNMLASNVLTINTNSGNIVQCMNRSLTTAANVNKSSVTTTLYWRPILELIPLNESIFGPRELYSIVDGINPPYAISGQYVDVARPPTYIYGEQADMQQPQLLTYSIV